MDFFNELIIRSADFSGAGRRRNAFLFAFATTLEDFEIGGRMTSASASASASGETSVRMSACLRSAGALEFLQTKVRKRRVVELKTPLTTRTQRGRCAVRIVASICREGAASRNGGGRSEGVVHAFAYCNDTGRHFQLDFWKLCRRRRRRRRWVASRAS